MANTTFNGPVRSQHGFITLTTNPTTGIETKNYLGTKPDFTGLTAASVSTATNVSLTRNTVNAVDFTGAAACTITLPSVSDDKTLVNTWVVYAQAVDTTGGTAALKFKTSGSDVFRTGSVFESRATNKLTFVTSAAGNNTLTITPANVVTNHVSIGSYIYFSCTEAGLWNVNFDLAKDFAALTGAAAWSTV
tara:strand:- start:486 stop:1058 length:573 start_codon:yes stop_codon:yes gene_type:complete